MARGGDGPRARGRGRTLRGEGVDEVWAATGRLVDHLRSTGTFDEQRAHQSVAWMWDEVREQLLESFRDDEVVAKRLADTEREVRAGHVSATTAAHDLLAAHGLRDDDAT